MRLTMTQPIWPLCLLLLGACPSRGGLSDAEPLPEDAAAPGGTDDGGAADGAAADAGGDLGDPACIGKLCDTPPSAACMGKTLRSYAARGTCQAGTCSYASMDQACPVACSGGKCANCPTGFTQWPCYPPATVATTCCDNPRRTCANGRGCTCYDACN